MEADGASCAGRKLKLVLNDGSVLREREVIRQYEMLFDYISTIPVSGLVLKRFYKIKGSVTEEDLSDLFEVYCDTFAFSTIVVKEILKREKIDLNLYYDDNQNPKRDYFQMRVELAGCSLYSICFPELACTNEVFKSISTPERVSVAELRESREEDEFEMEVKVVEPAVVALMLEKTAIDSVGADVDRVVSAVEVLDRLVDTYKHIGSELSESPGEGRLAKNDSCFQIDERVARRVLVAVKQSGVNLNEPLNSNSFALVKAALMENLQFDMKPYSVSNVKIGNSLHKQVFKAINNKVKSNEYEGSLFRNRRVFAEIVSRLYSNDVRIPSDYG